MAELQIDRIADQKEILKKQLGGGDISEALREEIIDELSGIRQRWESPRSENANQEREDLC